MEPEDGQKTSVKEEPGNALNRGLQLRGPQDTWGEEN